jgi:hypothetical protein
VFKLGRYLVSFTGDAKYADWIERVLIDGIGASIPMSPDGSVFYFSDYSIDGASGANHNPWSCCAGRRPMAAADFHDLVYFHNDANLYVTLFAPSSVTWTRNGATVRLTQETSFPGEDRTEFLLDLDHPTNFELKIRVPGWLAGPMQATLNGKPAALRQDQQHRAVLSRTWQNGDRLAVTLPSSFWLAHPPGTDPGPAAVMPGPVTLAFRSPGGNPWAKFDFRDVKVNFAPHPAQPLNYHVAADADVLARPFDEFKEGEQYFMYLLPDLDQWGRPMRLASALNVLNTPRFSFTDGIGSTIEYPFNGRSIRWTGFRFEDGGQAEASIDGDVMGMVDQYGSAHMPATPPVGPSLPFEWEYKGLTPGHHRLRIRTLPGKNSASKGHRITVARIDAHP